ncbi:MAG: exodeoxyribonuclease III [Myxococcota bacterium]
MRFLSFNVNGIRACAKKTLIDDLMNSQADVIGLQETKATPEQVKETLEALDGYSIYAYSAEKKGYSGTAILSKIKPLSVTYGIGINEHDSEGRCITAEYDDLYYVTAYIPNAGSGLKRLDYRSQRWDPAFRSYLVDLAQTKPVVLCGDLNVAHQPIDIARPKSNYNKSAGYTQAEIDGFTALLKAGFVDTFRHLHPEEVKYSWWSYRTRGRDRNIGWRLDYFMVSERLLPKVSASLIRNDIFGSDHCPVELVLD